MGFVTCVTLQKKILAHDKSGRESFAMRLGSGIREAGCAVSLPVLRCNAESRRGILTGSARGKIIFKFFIPQKQKPEQ
jgi:hypothetical protein